MYENKVMPTIKDAVQGRTAFLIRQANYITSALLDAHHQFLSDGWHKVIIESPIVTYSFFFMKVVGV